MTAVVSLLVSLLGQLVPLIGTNSAMITTIINALIQIVPAIVSEVESLIPPIKNIIAALSADPATTDEQLATLAALDQQCDEAFEAAATAAEAEDGTS
jgi:hypothetical protein